AIPLQNNPNLVMHLPFDETSGSVAADVSGNGNDGTVLFVDDNGATKTPSATNWTSQGLFGGAVQMDGETFQSNTIVEVPYSASIGATSQSITVMAWVNRDDLDNNVGIMTHDYPAMFFGFHNSLYKWEFATNSGGGDCYSGYSPAGQWVHIAATYDGATARLFANGVEVCTQAVTGDIAFDSSTPNFSSFVSSGFYETRDPATNIVLISNNYNESGVTDEIKGKIDELKIYNTALDGTAIKALYDAGVAQGVPACPPGTITAEYSIDGAPWVTGNVINAPIGAQVAIRAQTSGTYYVTTAQNDNESPTFESGVDFTQTNGYIIDQAVDIGANNQLTLTTAGGCPAVVSLNVVQGCDPGDEPISAEWRIADGNYENGNPGENVSITATVGDEVRLSILPNEFPGTSTRIGFSVTLPNGTVVNQSYSTNLTDYIIPAVDTSDGGNYVLTSEEGCSVIVSLSVNGFDCSEIKAEWSLEGGETGSYQSAPDTNPVVVDAFTGDDVRISLLPNGIDFTVTYNSVIVYNGNTDFVLGVVDPSDSGDYVLETVQGCITTLTLNVADPVCDASTIKAEWRLNGTYFEAPDEQPVTVDVITGDTFEISLIPNGTEFTISFEGNEVYNGELDYDLGNVELTDSGVYTITTEYGCVTTLTLNVSDVVCDGNTLKAEWRLNGDYFSAPDNQPITVDVASGDAFEISMLPNGIVFTIEYEGNEVYNDQFDYDLGNVTPANSGDYVITSANGCSTTLTLNVLCPSGPFTPEYLIDSISGSGEEAITVNVGAMVILGTVEDNVAFTITPPSGPISNGDLDLGQITLADAGQYLFTSVEGCTKTLDIIVIDPCAPGNFTPEYTVDGIMGSGDVSITVEEGEPVVLSLIQTDVTYTITAPDATITNGLLDLGNIAASDEGSYIYNSDSGCSATLDIVVTTTCPTGGFTPEYTVDGTAGSGDNSITIEQGTPISLGIVETGITYTITAPDDTVSNGALDLGNITLAMAGEYTFQSDAGCNASLTIVVTDSSCDPSTFTPQYTINGIAEDGELEINVQEGTPLVLGLVQSEVAYTITLPDSSINTGLLNLGNITSAQAGTYTFVSDTGCTAQLIISVEENPESDKQIEDVVIYPNPVSDGKVRAVLSDFLGETIYISFYDIYGKLVLQNIVPENHGAEVEFDISILSSGTYIIEISRTNNDENTLKKVIKLR
ncbi:LamG-like jellyroll fold domain-containing protein, partial [Maribacter algicola]